MADSENCGKLIDRIDNKLNHLQILSQIPNEINFISETVFVKPKQSAKPPIKDKENQHPLQIQVNPSFQKNSLFSNPHTQFPPQPNQPKQKINYEHSMEDTKHIPISQFYYSTDSHMEPYNTSKSISTTKLMPNSNSGKNLKLDIGCDSNQVMSRFNVNSELKEETNCNYISIEETSKLSQGNFLDEILNKKMELVKKEVCSE